MSKQVGLTLYRYLYRPLVLGYIALSTAFFGSIAFLGSFVDARGNRVHYVGKLWAWLALWVAGVRVRMHGLENIDRSHPYVVMSNHQSHFDVLSLIARLPLQLRWVMKKELRRVPIFGPACERMGHIYVDRGDRDKARRSLRAAGEKIRAGASVVFFPEGTRSYDGKLLPFKKGGFVIALEARVPILPITVNDSRHVLPAGTARLLPGVIHVTVHPPLLVDDYDADERDELAAEVRRVIQSGLRVD